MLATLWAFNFWLYLGLNNHIPGDTYIEELYSTGSSPNFWIGSKIKNALAKFTSETFYKQINRISRNLNNLKNISVGQFNDTHKHTNSPNSATIFCFLLVTLLFTWCYWVSTLDDILKISPIHDLWLVVQSLRVSMSPG